MCRYHGPGDSSLQNINLFLPYHPPQRYCQLLTECPIYIGPNARGSQEKAHFRIDAEDEVRISYCGVVESDTNRTVNQKSQREEDRIES